MVELALTPRAIDAEPGFGAAWAPVPGVFGPLELEARAGAGLKLGVDDAAAIVSATRYVRTAFGFGWAPALPKVPVVGLAGRGFLVVGAAWRTAISLFSTYLVFRLA